MPHSAARIVIGRIAGFIFFLILLGVANILAPSTQNQVFIDIVVFFNSNLLLLLAITFIGMANEIFWNSSFPALLLAPISGTILSIYNIMFFYALWNFLDSSYFKTNAPIPINTIYAIVPLFVLVIGYITVLSRSLKKKEPEKKRKKTEKKTVEWEDVGEEFKLFFYNVGKAFNSIFKKK